MRDFTKILFKKGYGDWPSKLWKMSQLVARVERQTVVAGIRDAAIFKINSAELYPTIEGINKIGLVITPLMRMEKKDCFSITGGDSSDPNADWSVCLTRDYESGQKFKKAFIKSDHLVMGKMLGYPDCCIKYFAKTFPVDPVPIWNGLSGKVKGYTEANGMLRYFGPKLTSHFSCSPNCEKTREVGRAWFKEMEKMDKKLAKEMYDLLAGPMTWNSYHGVVQIETPYFLGLNSSLYIQGKPRIIDWRGK